MFIDKLIYDLNGLCFGFTFYYPIFDGYRKLSIATPNMYMRRIVIESIDVYQNTLYNEDWAHNFDFYGAKIGIISETNKKKARN